MLAAPVSAVAWKPLPIWCADGQLDAADLARLREAKESLWLDYTVKPCEATEGSIEERVLAWGTTPTFLCEYALVDPAGPDSEIEAALAWVLDEAPACRTAVTIDHFLSALLSASVREVPADELEAEQRLADYERGI